MGQVIVRSVLDRTLRVLFRAVMVAAPAGLLLWILGTVTVEGQNLLWYLTNFLDPLGRLLGMSGVVLAAFLLGLPANEIVLPIVVLGRDRDVPTGCRGNGIGFCVAVGRL